ncbi:Hypothetical predicted protein [Marmota monax]|uniref:Uncharacterized protein n=1 Tax=Marmota monax TaxID=9995 RepID=A0A5E4BTB8_MARMO|nr:hypothetical protein GHT09_017290 [Marmota monax]VTJ72745.1 Hypothetical predicted protein [Marmota monax]
MGCGRPWELSCSGLGDSRGAFVLWTALEGHTAGGIFEPVRTQSVHSFSAEHSGFDKWGWGHACLELRLGAPFQYPQVHIRALGWSLPAASKGLAELAAATPSWAHLAPVRLRRTALLRVRANRSQVMERSVCRGDASEKLVHTECGTDGGKEREEGRQYRDPGENRRAIRELAAKARGHLRLHFLQKDLAFCFIPLSDFQSESQRRRAEETAEPSRNRTGDFGRIRRPLKTEDTRGDRAKGTRGQTGFNETGAEVAKLIDSCVRAPPPPPRAHNSAWRRGLSLGEEKGKSRNEGLLIN